MNRVWIVEKWNRLHRRFEPVIGNVASTREGCRLLVWECHRYDRFNMYRTALYRRAEKAEQQLAGLKSEWFRKGQESVQRKNESGCCCKIDDDDEILSACDAHSEWATQQLTEKDREIASLKSDARFQLTEKMLEAAARKQRELEAELAELRRAR